MTDDAGCISLQVTLRKGCEGLVLDLLSSASFAADSDLSAEDIEPNGYRLVEISKNALGTLSNSGRGGE
jgi:hypothetical protein